MDKLTQHLRAIVGREAVLDKPEELLVYECDGLPQHKLPPRAVVFPQTTEQVAEIVRALTEAKVSYAPRGAGTGLSGGALACDRGVIIELARMRRLLEMDYENRRATVQTGLVNAQLSRAAAHHGLSYAPDPSSQTTCTIGGNIAENAGGIHCLKYGVTVDHVIAARVVLPDGNITVLGGDGWCGYDLLGVFIGSEGTFGIATEATLNLVPLPAAVRTLLADFIDINRASAAVSAIIAAGFVPAALEMMDGATIRAVEASVFSAGLPTDAEAALLIELDGLEAGLDDEAARCAALCRTHGARHVRFAADDAERKKLWAARKGAFGAMGRISPDIMLQDAVVPRSRLPEILAATYAIAAKYDLTLANVFHAGDGNLHPYICFDSRYPEQVKRVKEAGREMMEVCVGAGGTITGEHGVGLDKSDYLPLVFSADDMDAMLRVRAAFDPHGLCNPGKIIPIARGCGEARAGIKTRFVDNDEDAPQAARKTSSPPPRAKIDAASSDERFYVAATSSNKFAKERAYTHIARIIGAQRIETADDGASPLLVEPHTIEEAREIIALARSEKWSLRCAGARTFSAASSSNSAAELILATTGLTRLIEHEPADLVASAEAGLTLSNFNRSLADAGQWLALDPPDDARATIGGVAATGIAGAQSMAYGGVRAHVIGMQVITADGRLIKAGGKVVKNVAGYDLCKLYVGSYGTLGLITELTFKLRPRPAREATIIFHDDNVDDLIAFARTVYARRLLPVALELLSPACCAALALDVPDKSTALAVRFAGNHETVAAQIDDVSNLFRALAKDADGRMLLSHDDQKIWRDLAALSSRGFASAAALSLRIQVAPMSLTPLVAALCDADLSREQIIWQAGIGDGKIRAFVPRVDGDAALWSQTLARLRDSVTERKGLLMIETMPSSLSGELGRYQTCETDGAAASVMRRTKAQLDPTNIFGTAHFSF